jgi:hypothetical protein
MEVDDLRIDLGDNGGEGCATSDQLLLLGLLRRWLLWLSRRLSRRRATSQQRHELGHVVGAGCLAHVLRVGVLHLEHSREARTVD